MDFEKIVNPIVKDIPPSGIRKFFDLSQSNGRCYFFRGSGTWLARPLGPRDSEKLQSIQLKKEKHSILQIKDY